jgi:hypothetical protein
VPLSRLDLPKICGHIEDMIRALDRFPREPKPTDIVTKAHDQLLEDLMPSGVDYNLRAGADEDITDSDLDLRTKVILQDLLQLMGPSFGHLRHREKNIVQLMDWAKYLSGKQTKQTTHSVDFTSVVWFGTPYSFAKGLQAQSVRVLWEAWENGTPSLSEKTIGEEAGSASDNFRLEHVFKPVKKRTRKREPHPAWGTMIKSAGKGLFTLSPP